MKTKHGIATLNIICNSFSMASINGVLNPLKSHASATFTIVTKTKLVNNQPLNELIFILFNSCGIEFDNV